MTLPRLGLLLIILLSSTSFESKATSDEFNVAYGTSVATIARKAIKRIEEASSIKVNVEQDLGMSADSVLISVTRGSVELGIAGNSWEDMLELAHIKKLVINNIDKVHHSVLGVDHIKVAVYSGGPSTLSKDQLNMIFSGKSTNWKDVGGEDAPIKIVLTARMPATEQVFAKALLGGGDIFRKGSKTFQTIMETAKFIRETKGAIGLFSGGNEVPGLNYPLQPSVEKTVTGLTLGEPSDRSKKLMEEVSRALKN